MCRGTGLVQNFQTPIYIYTSTYVYIYVYIYGGDQNYFVCSWRPYPGATLPACWIPSRCRWDWTNSGAKIRRSLEENWIQHFLRMIYVVYVHISIYLSIYGYIWMIRGILSKYIYFISIYGKSPFWFLAVLKRSEVKKLIFVDFRGFIG